MNQLQRAVLVSWAFEVGILGALVAERYFNMREGVITAIGASIAYRALFVASSRRGSELSGIKTQ